MPAVVSVGADAARGHEGAYFCCLFLHSVVLARRRIGGSVLCVQGGRLGARRRAVLGDPRGRGLAGDPRGRGLAGTSFAGVKEGLCDRPRRARAGPAQARRVGAGLGRRQGRQEVGPDERPRLVPVRARRGRPGPVLTSRSVVSDPW